MGVSSRKYKFEGEDLPKRPLYSRVKIHIFHICHPLLQVVHDTINPFMQFCPSLIERQGLCCSEPGHGDFVNIVMSGEWECGSRVTE